MRGLTGLIICWAMVSTLAMGQTVIELEEQEVLGHDLTIPQVGISVFMMKISPELAADWGLDGGPAAKPESTPLKKDIPRLLAPEEARKLITALRNAKGTEILCSNSLVVQSGQEGFGDKVNEIMFPESYEDDVYFEPTVPDDDDGEKEKMIIKRRRPLPKGEELTIWDLAPIMGEPRQDLGFTLTATPQVSASGRTINIDFHPKLTVEKKAKPMFFMFSTFELRTQVDIPNGYTLIPFCGVPAPQGDYADYKQDAVTDRRPFIMFVTAKVVDYPKQAPVK